MYFSFQVCAYVDIFFLKQLQSMEESAEILRERSLKFYKGCRKYTYAPNLSQNFRIVAVHLEFSSG